MKKIGIVSGLALLLAILSSCLLPFAPSAFDLAGKTLSYSYNINNGARVITLSFDQTGEAGAFVYELYQIGWENVDDTDDYLKQKLVHFHGSKGTFTYDPEQLTAETIVTHRWVPTDDAVFIDNGIYSEYAYELLKDTQPSSIVDYELSYSGTAIVTADFAVLPGIEGLYSGNPLADRGDSNYVLDSTATHLWKTATGLTQSIIEERTTTLYVTGTNLNLEFKTVTTSDNGTHDLWVQNEITKTYFDVTAKYGKGSTSSEQATFNELWKENSSISFQVVRTALKDVAYDDDDDIPPIPSIDPVTGTGGSQDGTPHYYLDKTPYHTSINIDHHGTFVILNLANDMIQRSVQ